MARIDKLLDDFLRSEFEDSPTFATSLGVDGHDRLAGAGLPPIGLAERAPLSD